MKTNKPTHTPGPWFVIDERHFQGRFTCEVGEPMVGGKTVCSIETTLSKESAEFQANARLIAAAPDLKRFAESIEESVNDALRPGSPDTFMSLVKRLQDYRAWARAAIAKAEGLK